MNQFNITNVLDIIELIKRECQLMPYWKIIELFSCYQMEICFYYKKVYYCVTNSSNCRIVLSNVIGLMKPKSLVTFKLPSIYRIRGI